MNEDVSVDKLIYTILKRFEVAMDEENPDFKDIRHEALGISKTRWKSIMLMLVEEGLITGATIMPDGNNRLDNVFIKDARITLKGIKYLADNSNIAKIVSAAKLI